MLTHQLIHLLTCSFPQSIHDTREKDNLYVRLTIFTFFTTAILFTAETITLNRLSLVFKAPQVGFWSKLKRRRSFLAASHSLFATEVAHARASEGLLVCSAALSGLLASQTLLVLVSLHWVPYACLIIGTFTSSVRLSLVCSLVEYKDKSAPSSFLSFFLSLIKLSQLLVNSLV